VSGCCKCGDEPSGSCATELVELADNSRVVKDMDNKLQTYNTANSIIMRRDFKFLRRRV
jgi:hypothetical protein